jgi:transcriptional regulator with XRE-family HTH domain
MIIVGMTIKLKEKYKYPKIFGNNLRHIREDRGFSQEKVGELSGLTGNFVGAVERAECSISLKNMEILAECLNVDLIVLLSEDEINN